MTAQEGFQKRGNKKCCPKWEVERGLVWTFAIVCSRGCSRSMEVEIWMFQVMYSEIHILQHFKMLPWWCILSLFWLEKTSIKPRNESPFTNLKVCYKKKVQLNRQSWKFGFKFVENAFVISSFIKVKNQMFDGNCDKFA